MRDIKAIIFDCDGVMFDSHGANLAFYNSVFREFSYPQVTLADPEKARLCHTASTPVVLETLLDPQIYPEALTFAQKLDYRQFIPFMTPHAHLQTALGRLQQCYPLAVATNRGSSIGLVLEQFSLQKYFSVVVCSLDVERPKPAPDMLLLAARRLNVEPGACLFVGDSELDRKAALEAGMKFTGYGAVSGSDVAVASHLELVELLANCCEECSR